MQLLNALKSCNLKLIIEIFNCLIDGLCKAGKVDTAWELFENMFQEGPQPNVVTYNIMIHGYSKGGQEDKANNLFQKMEESCCTPNTITYNALLLGSAKVINQRKWSNFFIGWFRRMCLRMLSLAPIVVDMLSTDEKYQEFLDLLPSFPVQKCRG